MEALAQPTGTTTVILDLKDVCLRKVFALLDPDDLAAVADVCARFRVNAVQSAGAKFKNLKFFQNISVNDYSKLRNFGELIDSVCVCGDLSQKSYAKYQKRIIEFVVQYCVGETIKLDLYEFDITDELAYLMLPLLGRVHGLFFSQCQFAKVFLTKLSLWSPELRYLEFWLSKLSIGETQFGVIRQKFPKLEYIQLSHIEDLQNSDIAEFLKLNPQLKEFYMFHCDNIDDSIFSSMAKFAPEIEEIHFCPEIKTDRNNIEYFGQLRELKTLDLRIEDDRSYIPLVVHKIGSANIALEHLEVFGCDITQEFIGGISKLPNLKSMCVRSVDNMTTTHLVEISKHLKDLSEYKIIGINLKMNQEDLLKLVQTAGKLQKFEYQDPCFPVQISSNIDADTFNKLVKSVEQRSEKIPLALLLSNHFTADIPAKLTKAASEFLTLQIKIPEFLMRTKTEIYEMKS